LDKLLKEDPALKDKFKQGLKTDIGGEVRVLPLLTPDDMAVIEKKMPRGTVKIVKQCAGDVVHVKPGVIHAVYNLQPCLKIAVEIFVQEHMEFYAVAHAGLIHYFPKGKDFMGALKVAYRCWETASQAR
jgi:hypothetical protein